LTNFIYPLAGLICHGITLVVMLISSAFIQPKRAQNFLVSLSLIPLIRLVSLSIPLGALPQIYWYLLVYLPLLASLIAVMRILGIKPFSIGLVKKNLPVYAASGVILGFALGLAEWFILVPKPLAGEFTLQAIIGPAFILFFTTGLIEELIFRGVLQHTATDFMGTGGLIYISIVFAVMHTGHKSVLEVLFVLLVGLCFSWIVRRTGSLIPVIVAHGVTNIVLYLLAPFLLG
jgi:uncharacterized protein